jgi:hypothetical protein
MPHAERSPLEPEPVPEVDPMAPQVLADVEPMPDRDQPAPLIDTRIPTMASTDAPLATAHASPEQIIESLSEMLQTAQASQRDGIDAGFKLLARPAKPAPDWMTQLIGGIAELVVALPLGQVAAALTHALIGGGDATKGIVSQLARIASRVGQSANAAVTGTFDGGADRDLLERYRVDVECEVRAAHARARIDFGLAHDQLATLSPAVLGRMADRLLPTGELLKRLLEEQRQAVVFGWMRLCAALAQETETIARTGAGGFVDVYVSCPERIDGARGCRVEHLDVNAQPAVADLVKSLARGIIALPVHRRVFLSTQGTGAGGGWSEPAYELDPDHQITILPGAHLLAAIGSGGIAATGELQPDIEHHQALAGAAAVNDVLSTTAPRFVP